MNQREAVKVLRQLLKEVDHNLPFVNEPGGRRDIYFDIINLLIAVDYFRNGLEVTGWRQRMFDDYLALRMACAKYQEIGGYYDLMMETHSRCHRRGTAFMWQRFFIKNCISILHEGQIYH